MDPASTEVRVVIGNHDVGFHYAVTPFLENRFERAFDVSSVDRSVSAVFAIKIAQSDTRARNRIGTVLSVVQISLLPLATTVSFMQPIPLNGIFISPSDYRMGWMAHLLG